MKKRKKTWLLEVTEENIIVLNIWVHHKCVFNSLQDNLSIGDIVFRDKSFMLRADYENFLYTCGPETDLVIDFNYFKRHILNEN